MGIFSKLFGDSIYRKAPWLKTAARAFPGYDLWVECPEATRIAELAESSLKLSNKATHVEARKSYLTEAREHLDELKEMMKEYPSHAAKVMGDLESRVKFFEDELEIEILNIELSKEEQD